MADGFLGRWSKRKLEAKDGKPLADQPASVAPPVAVVAQERVEAATAPAGEQPGVAAEAELPMPTLDDVQALTPESDFSRFAARSVAPDVRNAAMKKLFADPRYNVMDRLDVYVDDYSGADPIAPGQLRQLAGAQFLGLFRQEELDAQRDRARDVADNPSTQSVAHCDAQRCAVSQPSPHADPDLQLQQDHAPAGEDPGGGAG